MEQDREAGSPIGSVLLRGPTVDQRMEWRVVPPESSVLPGVLAGEVGVGERGEDGGMVVFCLR